MRGRIWTVISSFTSLIAISLLLLPSASASGAWAGNDNGEFQNKGGTPNNNGIEAYLGNQPLRYHNSPPYNTTSLQYNPDYALTFVNNGGAWEQAGIIGQGDANGGNGLGCSVFTVQIWDLFFSNDLLWYQNVPNSGCNSTPLIFTAYSGWYITEYVSSNLITSIYFELWPFGGSIYSTTIYPPQNQQYLWTRSNVCWCGVGGGSTTYTIAGGTIYYTSNLHFETFSPPTQISTREDSNMEYGCFNNADSTLMYQSYGLSGHC